MHRRAAVTRQEERGTHRMRRRQIGLCTKLGLCVALRMLPSRTLLRLRTRLHSSVRATARATTYVR